MSLVDAAARRRAIDPLISCCVTAPAGSGKTELLIQRVLALLGRVEDPECVVAITFTRKAAAEMRARLVAALQSAAAGAPIESAHQRLTRDLANTVLQCDSAQKWGLISNPSRLRIRTIDSLCRELTRQMPILSGSGGELQSVDDSGHLYREAVDDFLATTDSGPESDLRRVLLHLDNDWARAADLLQSLLGKRDQWQRLLGMQQLGERQRGQLDAVVAALVEEALDRLRGMLVRELPDLRDLLAYRGDNLNLDIVFDAPSNDLAGWRILADALLTDKGEWRKSLTVRQGFPKEGDLAKAKKAQMGELLSELRERDSEGELLGSVKLLRSLPDPDVDERHWQVLRSLVALLPTLAAQLLLVFKRRGAVDHAQVSLAAIAALGEDDQPTDLALRLDHRIEHLLVDEFQDTSSGQFELLRRLTRGWADHNHQDPELPRTVLVVGDAMQSIYGFRAANVGLFMRARDHGIGDLSMEPLSLRVNFRSTAAIVSWVNRHFAQALPASDDPQLGAVSYRPSEPALSGGDRPALQVFSGDAGRDSEVDWICAELQKGLDDEAVNSIAILGRSRNQLLPLLRAMRERGISYAGRNLDSLGQRMVVLDLLTLCQVLQNHYDRFAWLSLLRGPWVALEHGDLLSVALHTPWAAALIRDQDVLPDVLCEAMSEAGQARLAALVSVLRWAEQFRDRLALRVWVEEVWLRLGGAAAHPDRGAQSDAEQFLQVVEALELDGRGLQLALLKERVNGLYAAPGDENSTIQVMTLHKAKGLEFDWVFIPSLNAGTARGNSDLLLWDEVLLPSAEPAFLLDIRAARDAAVGNRIYDYLKLRQQQKSQFENARLLYVGCTRAAQRLFLSASTPARADDDAKVSPASGSLLSSLTLALEEEAVWVDVDTPSAERDRAQGSFRRLERLPELESFAESAPGAAIPLETNRLPRALGVAVHRAAESLVYRATLPAIVDEPLRALLQCTLTSAGCELALLSEFTERGSAALNTMLGDKWARWMLSPERLERSAEFALTLVAGGKLQHLVLDYSFLDEQRGERWVVDYKTSMPDEGQSVDDFLLSEVARYTEQIGGYRHALSAIRPQPVRCALYFLGLGRSQELTNF